MKREFLRNVQQHSLGRRYFHQVRELYIINNVDINFVLKATSRYFIRCNCSHIKLHNYDWPWRSLNYEMFILNRFIVCVSPAAMLNTINNLER